MSRNGNRKPGLSSVREQTYRVLRERLLAGEFIPGQRLTEESIAQGLGVSRTPVREALHKLELEGLVEPAGDPSSGSRGGLAVDTGGRIGP